MTKVLLFWASVLVCFLSSGQVISAKFQTPERLITRGCQNSQDQFNCLFELFQENIIPVINKKENLKILKKLKRDSLKLELKFTVNNFGDLIDSTTTLSLNRFKNSDILADKIKKKISNLPRFLVQNRKPPKFSSYHTMKMVFLKNKETGFFEITLPTEKYKGGIVEEAPKFPGCQNIDQELYHRQCFQEMMQKHIRKNFKYPQNALRDRIKGVVYIDLIIDKNGRTKKMKAKGPHPLLEEEAKRIMTILPQLIPGKYDGIVSEYPYSIPITFAIR